VLYLPGITDAHCENLIAEGSLLHLIDAETLFQSNATAACVAEDLWGAGQSHLNMMLL
jgi:lantibiotic modifying enzyme